MKINESYFKDLLLRTDALEAVTTLDRFWCTHLDSDEQIWFGLSEPEHHVHMCLIYTGEVGNGGHTQFFLNRGRYITERALRALRAMELGNPRDCLERACRVFPGGTLPWEPEEVERALDGFSNEQMETLQSLDKELWAIRDVDQRLLAYLRLHEDEVLRAERGP